MQTNHTQPERIRRTRSLRLFVCILSTVYCPLFLVGCRSNNRYDLIEAELRTRERELADTRAQLDQARNLVRAYEASQQRGAPAPGGGVYLPVKEVAIARGTGGLDEDGAPGDEGLLVVISPRDEDGSAVKVPARVLIGAWEITPAGLKNPIGSWNVSADKLRQTWKSGLISSGYFVAVPWQTLPSTDRVRVAVRLVTTDGRAFEADRDVTVRPPSPPRGGADGGNVLPYPAPALPSTPVRPGPPMAPPAPPGGGRQPLFPEMAPPGVPPAIPPGTEELPPPAPLDRGARFRPPERP